jgi:hypothetical protein
MELMLRRDIYFNSRKHADRDRVLDENDFPRVSLSSEQRAILAKQKLTLVILDNNKPGLATVQAEMVGQWGIGDQKIIYVTNGDTSIQTVTGEQTLKRPLLSNHLGVPDLIATATQFILEKAQPSDWIFFASADVWILNPERLKAYFADALLQNSQLITSYCGGLGLRGMLSLSDYYLRDGNVSKNTFRASGLMTEFFGVRADLARITLANWNNPNVGRKCYQNLHQDPRLSKYISAGRGTVEAHFRYLMAQALGPGFGEKIFLMHPRQNYCDRVYPLEIGYTSTHSDTVRKQNVAVAEKYGFQTNMFPGLKKWLRDLDT